MKYQQRGEDLVQISMKFPRRLWKKLRLRAVRDETTATQIMVKLAEDFLARKTGEGKKED